MNIVLFGASGFIGRRVAQILHAHGHTLRTPSRREFDYLQPNEAAAHEILRGTDAVFNCIGVMSRHADVLETVHHRTPALLAKIAAEQGVRHWVQLSALGADPKHAVHFVGSKGCGDEAVCQIGAAHGMRVVVARPSVVYGAAALAANYLSNWHVCPLLPCRPAADSCSSPCTQTTWRTAWCACWKTARRTAPSFLSPAACTPAWRAILPLCAQGCTANRPCACCQFRWRW